MLAHVLCCHETNALIGFFGNPGNVRREQKVGNTTKCRTTFTVHRLGLEDIQCRTAESTLAQRFDYRTFVDDTTSRGVDEYCPPRACCG